MAHMRHAVVFFADAKLFPAAAFAADRAASLNRRRDVDVIVLTNDAQAITAASARPWPFRIAPLVLAKNITLPPHYYRLFIPELLREKYSRVLYLDTDTYLDDDRAFALFDLDMAGQAVAGVRDVVVAFAPDAAELQRTLRTAGTKYLNTGVLMIHCAAFARRKILAAIPGLLPAVNVAGTYYDQTVLNLILDGDWLELSPTFNMFGAALGSSLSATFPPAITHFAGPTKPWRVATTHPAASEMARFFRASPWPSFFSPATDASVQAGAPGSDWTRQFGRSLTDYLTSVAFADVDGGIVKPVM